MTTKRELVKTFIEIAPNVDEADKVIDKYYGFNSISEKISFLQGMFDVENFHKHDAPGTSKEESDKMTYFAMLSAIINS